MVLLILLMAGSGFNHGWTGRMEVEEDGGGERDEDGEGKRDGERDGDGTIYLSGVRWWGEVY